MSLTIRPCRLEECAGVLDLWRQAEAIPRPTDTLHDVERDEPQAVGFWNAAPGWGREPRWHRYAKDI